MPKQYEIKAMGENEAELLIYGDIGDSWFGDSVTAKEVAEEISGLDVEYIAVRINSYGGSVSDGIAIYNSLKRHDAVINVHIDGVAVSIASLIAMAGDTIEMAENALFMVHAPWSGKVGNSKELRDFADLLDKYAEAMASSYMNKTGKSHEEIMVLLTDGADHWYTASEAEEFGFIDIVSEDPVDIAAGFDKSRFAFAAPGKPETVPQKPAAQVAAKTKTTKEAIMPKSKQTTATTETSAVENNDEVTAQALADKESSVLASEKQRKQDIRSSFSPFVSRAGVRELLDECIDDHDITQKDANEKLLAKLGDGAEPIAGDVRVSVGESGSERLISDAVEALVSRSGNGQCSSGNTMRHMRMTEIAALSLQNTGLSVGGMNPMDMVGAAFTQSTSDFPVILENTMHKILLDSYGTAADTWRRFCSVGSVSDFRAHKRVRTGAIGNIDDLNELGEFENKSIPDGSAESVSVSTKGNIINISREAIINDDLGYFSNLSKMFGRAAARRIEADVYALLAANPTMGDGVALFHANHGNLAASGAAISVATVDAARVAMGSQKDISGKDYLDLRPAIMLCGLDQGGDARTLNEAQYDPDTTNKLQKPNKVRGLFTDIVDTARLAVKWYMLADPNEAPVIEVAFLNGEQMPALETQDGFTVNGVKWRVRHDFGVDAVGFEGAYYNPGV